MRGCLKKKDILIRLQIIRQRMRLLWMRLTLFEKTHCSLRYYKSNLTYFDTFFNLDHNWKVRDTNLIYQIPKFNITKATHRFCVYIIRVFMSGKSKIWYLEYILKVFACELVRGWGWGPPLWAKVVTNKPKNIFYFLIFKIFRFCQIRLISRTILFSP